LRGINSEIRVKYKTVRGLDNLVCVVTGLLTAHNAVQTPAGERDLSLIHYIHFIKNGFFSQQKQVYHLFQSIAEVKNEWS